MHFIALVRFRRKPTKANQAESDTAFARQGNLRIRDVGVGWTFGRYDGVSDFEVPDEQAIAKAPTTGPDREVA